MTFIFQFAFVLVLALLVAMFGAPATCQYVYSGYPYGHAYGYPYAAYSSYGYLPYGYYASPAYLLKK